MKIHGIPPTGKGRRDLGSTEGGVMTDEKNGKDMTRREFLERAGKLGGAFILSSLAGKAIAGEWEQGSMEFWSGNAFVQDCVDAGGEAEGRVRALVDGTWQDYSTVSLPDEFLEWNLTARLSVLENISMMVSGQGGAPPSLAGPHNAAMATRGGMRRDSRLTINNAFKGMGLCPRRDLIQGYIEHMNETIQGPMQDKLDFLSDIYSDSSNFDVTKMVSLELYATPDFETHTFLNLMTDPVTSLVFLDSRSFEVRGIGQLVDPGDESAGSYARDIVTYTNLAHSYFHGDFPRLFPGILVHVVEVFDNTPGTGRGVRIAPALI